MKQTVSSYIEQHDNDYTPLEEKYRQVTGAELVQDPYASVRYSLPNLTLSMSVVIPAWNALGKIERCLRAIEYSTFNLKYPTQLEVIVVDDDSPDGLWQALQKMSFNMNWKVFRQQNQGPGPARNTGVAIASGDILVFCDPDIIVSPFSLEEFAKRHQVLDKSVLLGFRTEIESDDPRIEWDALPQTLPTLLSPFMEDGRMQHSTAGWPESMCRETNHLKGLGKGKQIVMANGSMVTLPALVQAFLYSMTRQDFIDMGGHAELFKGYGFEDNQAGAAAITLGSQIIPVYSSGGYHISHPDLRAETVSEGKENYKRYEAFLASSLAANRASWVTKAKQRILDHFEKTTLVKKPYDEDAYLQPFNTVCLTPRQQGLCFYALGHFQKAVDAFAAIDPEQMERKTLVRQVRALRYIDEAQQASHLLNKLLMACPDDAELMVELAKALATQGKFKAARRWLSMAYTKDKAHPSVQFMIRPIEDYLRRARLHLHHGFYQVARWDYEGALIIDPTNKTAHSGREEALSHL